MEMADSTEEKIEEFEEFHTESTVFISPKMEATFCILTKCGLFEKATWEVFAGNSVIDQE